MENFLEDTQRAYIMHEYDKRCELSLRIKQNINDVMDKYALSARKLYNLVEISPQTYRRIMSFNPASNDTAINIPARMDVLRKVLLKIREFDV